VPVRSLHRTRGELTWLQDRGRGGLGSSYIALCTGLAPGGRREAASSALQRAARYVRLRDEANSLDAEAATWYLLWHLHANPDRAFPGGLGGQPVGGCGGRRTIHNRIADLIAEEDDLNRWPSDVESLIR
jgi:hypothetical protein